MTVKQIIFFVLMIFTLINCKNQSFTEEKVFSEIFPQLLDSFPINRKNLYPPPAPFIYDKDSNFIRTDSVVEKLIIEQNERTLKKIDSIDSRLLIGMVDSCLIIDLDDLKERTYSTIQLIQMIIVNNESLNSTSRKLNISRIKEPSDIQLTYKSKLDEKYTDIWRIKDRKFGGIISISKILFDKENKYGLLLFETHSFYMEGAGYFVIIEKEKGKWKVKRILMNWVT